MKSEALSAKKYKPSETAKGLEFGVLNLAVVEILLDISLLFGREELKEDGEVLLVLDLLAITLV